MADDLGKRGDMTADEPLEHETPLFDTFVAGTTHITGIEELASSLNVGDKLDLFHEPQNEHDKWAIVIKTVQGAKIGYVPRRDNATVFRILSYGKKVFARISAKEWRENWLKISINIYLLEYGKATLRPEQRQGMSEEWGDNQPHFLLEGVMREDDEQEHEKATLRPEQRQGAAEEWGDHQHHNLLAGLMSEDAMPFAESVDERFDEIMAGKFSRELEVFYYLADYGENTPPPGCIQRLFVWYKRHHEYKQGWLKLEICRKDQPEEIFEGEAEATTGHELALLAEGHNPRKWLGQVPGSEFYFGELIREGFSCWSLVLDYATGLKISLDGKDKGEKPDFNRLAFERDVLRYAQRKLKALRVSRPRHIRRVELSLCAPDGSSRWSMYAYQDYAHLQHDFYAEQEAVSFTQVLDQLFDRRAACARVHPELIPRIGAILQNHQVEKWHGFTSPGWTSEAPKTCEFVLTYNTRQQVLVQGLAGDGTSMPQGFALAMEELLAVLNEAMYSPARHAAPWDNRPHGLTAFHYKGGSWGMDTDYSTYWRLDPEGKVLRLVRSVYPDKAECTLRVEDVDKLEAVLAESGMLSWDGFDEHDNSICDSFGFELAISYADGRTVKADGYHRVPGGWKAFDATTKKVFAYLDSLLNDRDNQNT